MRSSVLDHIVKKYHAASDLDFDWNKDFKDLDVIHVMNEIIGLINSYEFKDLIPGYEGVYRGKKLKLILEGLQGIDERLQR